MASAATELADARYALPVAECLVACGAFTVDFSMPRERWFRWKSGILAPLGCDCRRLNAFPACRRLVDRALAGAIAGAFPGMDYIVGVAHGGIPWARAVADRLGLPFGYVRAQPRASGGSRVDCLPGGVFRAGARADQLSAGCRPRAGGLIDDEQASQLRHFYLNPRDHIWGH
jgi:hypothetical protein